MALSKETINEQIVATVEGLVGDMPADATEAEAQQYILDSRAIVAGVLATLEEILDKTNSPTIH
jgi:hypothetical protein